MTFTQAFGYFTIVLLLAVFIRVFWVYLLVIGVVLRLLFWLSVGAFVSAFIWMIFVENYSTGPIDKFWPTWLFFMMSYSALSVVFVLIYLDIFNYFKGFIREIFGK